MDELAVLPTTSSAASLPPVSHTIYTETEETKTETGVNVSELGSIFSMNRRSVRGRRVKPTQRMCELLEANEGKFEIEEDTNNNSEKSPGCRDFMAQFTAEERKIIEKAGRMGDEEEKSVNCFIEEKGKSTAHKNKSKSAAEARKTIVKRPGTVKGRLAKKLKIKF